jgi:hypothetical protein
MVIFDERREASLLEGGGLDATPGSCVGTVNMAALHFRVSILPSTHISLRLFLRLLAHLADPSYLGRGLPWAARCVEGEGATMGMGAKEIDDEAA